MTNLPGYEFRRHIFSTCVFVCLSSIAANSLAQPAPYQSFDGPNTVWQLLDPRPGVQVLAHGCVTSDAREGTGSERLSVIAPPGESAHFICPVQSARVLDELEARMWVKANRPGVILGARVVLPRSIDSVTHRPKIVFIEGTQYDQVDQWQQLSLTDVPKQLAARIRVLRTTPGANIDPHEAYLNAVVLIVPGGPGSAAAVWTDELVVDGAMINAAEDRAPPTDSNVEQAAFVSGGDRTARVPLVQIQDTTVFVAGKPFLPLAIEWNGEPLAFLAERGFNSVWIDRPPTAEQTAAAERADMWFICAPPRPDSLAAGGLGVSLDRVLAWNLGTPGEHELDYFRRWAELVREKDPAPHRPILIAPQSDWLPCSKAADVLLASRPDSGGLSAADFSQWLDERVILSRPGAPFWTIVPTQPSQIVRDQIRVLAPRSKLPLTGDQRQVEVLARAAGIHGCRGFLFQSTTPLNAGDDASRRRALALESVNRSLQIVEPWLTLGTKVGEAKATGSPATAAILQVERTRLLVLDARPSDAKPPAKSVVTPPPVNLTFIVPGVPDSNQVFFLSPAAMEPLASKRVAGGVQFTLDRNAADLVLLTEDPNVIANFRERVAREGPRAARRERDRLAARINSGGADAARLKQSGVDVTAYQQAVGAANSQIALCDAALNQGNIQQAFQLASAAYANLASASDQIPQKSSGVATLTSLPSAGLSDNFTDQFEIETTLKSLRPGDNLLSGGEFEDLGQLVQLGWQNVNQPLPGVQPKAELSTESPHSGRYCLQLSAQAVPPAAAPQIVARPLVRITSHPVHVTTGSVIEVSGWVRVPKPIVGNIDGLTIVDSLGGAELELRIRQSPDWQPFRLIRGVSETSDESVSFVLNGLGTASVDDVAVRVLGSPTARRLPATATASAPPAPAPQSAGLPVLSAPLNQR
ncbi:MAG TPA: hypothetical protein VGM76_05905 [Lacipirellulaceae bacterium]|jgi:hypothetical protein